MPLGLLGSWSALRGLSVEAPFAFVWATVLAQSLQVWFVLPITVKRLRGTPGQAWPVLSTILLIVLSLMALQLLAVQPDLSQRLVRLYCAFYIAVMCWGIAEEATVRDRFVPKSSNAQVPGAFRTHLLKIYALVALSFLVVNEALILAQMPLHIRVVTLSLMPIILHYIYEIVLRLTCLLQDQDSA